jgi:ribonuclease P protein component
MRHLPNNRSFPRSKGPIDLTFADPGDMKRPHFKDYRCYCEAHIPAEQAGAGTPSWLPRSDGDQKWSRGISSSSCEGPQAPLRVRGVNLPTVPGRLKKRSEFLAVAAANRRWTTPGLVLQARPYLTDISGSDETLSVVETRHVVGLRVGFTATKKIGNAVKRNRARRRLRAAVSDVLKDAKASSADLVVVARQGTIKRPYTELKNDLAAALRRLGIAQ